MKKIFIILSVISILIFGVVNVSAKTNYQEDIAKKIIRFHVIANSDSQSDQALKIKIKNNIIKYIQPKLKNCKNINESREVLKRNDKNMIKLAQNIVYSEGYKYKVRSTFSKENFPIKTYGNITLPEGKYEAYRIIIGTGSGRNWWCVMFPPLCFIDVTKGEVSSKKTEKQMKRVLSDKEYNSIDNTQSNKVVLKFKIGDFINSLH